MSIEKLNKRNQGLPRTAYRGNLSRLYDEQIHARRGMSKMESKSYDACAGVAIIPAAPFVLAEYFSPEVWKAVSIFLNAEK